MVSGAGATRVSRKGRTRILWTTSARPAENAYRRSMVVDSWRLQRRWRRLQRPVAGLLIGTGALFMWAQRNAPSSTVATAVATADVPAGRIVAASDVTLMAWPQDSRPAAASGTLDEIVGRRATAPIRAGEPLTTGRVVGPGLLAASGAGQVGVAIPPNPLTSSGLIRPGDHVDLVGRTQTGARTLVAAALVLTLTEESGTVLAVPAGSAASVVQAAATDSIAMVLRGDDG